MPHILHRDRWRKAPPPGWRLQFNHPLAQGIWSAQYWSEMMGTDALRGAPLQNLGAGSFAPRSRNYRGGRYVSGARPSGGFPYWFGAGRTPSLAVTSDITLLALLGGDGRSTFPTVRVKATSVYWQEGVPSIIEGDGTTNVMVARFNGVGNVNVSAVGTSSLGQMEQGKVVSAVYDNGVGIGLWVEGREEAFTSSALNLSLVPDEVHMTGAATIMEFPPITLGYARVLSEGEQRALAENPFQVFRPQRRVSFFIASGGGAIDLSVSSLAHAHAAEGITLTQAHALAVGDAAHAHAADAVALTQVHQLATADAAHAHAADGIALTQAHALATQDAGHGHTADAVALTQAHNLGTADAEHAHAADNIVLALPGQLDVQNIAHGHLADAVTLTQVHVLAVADALHPHAVDALNLSGAVDLVVDAATHGHVVDAVTLAQVHELLVANNEHLHTAEGLTLAAGLTLAVADALHEHGIDSVSLGQVHALVVSDAVHAQLATHLGLSIPGGSQGPHTIVVRGQTRTIVVIARSRIIRVAPVTVQ